MLSRIEIENIGPADELGISPGPGTTLLTGENGRGRTLILDAAWRALTGVWPGETNHSLGTGYRSVPMQHAKGAQINAVLTDQQGKEETFRAHYPAGRPSGAGLSAADDAASSTPTATTQSAPGSAEPVKGARGTRCRSGRTKSSGTTLDRHMKQRGGTTWRTRWPSGG